MDKIDVANLLKKYRDLIYEEIHFLTAASEKLELVVNGYKDVDVDETIKLVDNLRVMVGNYQKDFINLLARHSQTPPSEYLVIKRIGDTVECSIEDFKVNILELKQGIIKSLDIR